MNTLQITGNECLYVGDNPMKDFVTANKLRWSTVQILREKGEYSNIQVNKSHEAKYKIPSLYELKKIIESL